MVTRRELISESYLEQNRILHRSKEGFGGSGWKHIDTVLEFYKELGARSMLDYGCGECTLRRDMRKRGLKIPMGLYDPAIPKYAGMPNRADLVVCTDVMEHVEPAFLRAVLRHIQKLSIKGAYLAIATRPANKHLPNGKNAHAIVEDTPWWVEQVAVHMNDMEVLRFQDVRKGGVPTGAPHEVRFWLKRVPKQ